MCVIEPINHRMISIELSSWGDHYPSNCVVVQSATWSALPRNLSISSQLGHPSFLNPALVLMREQRMQARFCSLIVMYVNGSQMYLQWVCLCSTLGRNGYREMCCQIGLKKQKF